MSDTANSYWSKQWSPAKYLYWRITYAYWKGFEWKMYTHQYGRSSLSSKNPSQSSYSKQLISTVCNCTWIRPCEKSVTSCKCRAMDQKTDYCRIHEIQFQNTEQYTHHTNNECSEMLEKAVVCTYVKGDGKCCAKHFRHISTLILHYRNEHKKYACVHCYQVFDRKSDLEKHDHPRGSSLRESKWGIQICENVYNSVTKHQVKNFSILSQSHTDVDIAFLPLQNHRHKNNTKFLPIADCQPHEMSCSRANVAQCATIFIQPKKFWKNTCESSMGKQMALSQR